MLCFALLESPEGVEKGRESTKSHKDAQKKEISDITHISKFLMVQTMQKSAHVVH